MLSALKTVGPHPPLLNLYGYDFKRAVQDNDLFKLQETLVPLESCIRSPADSCGPYHLRVFQTVVFAPGTNIYT